MKGMFPEFDRHSEDQYKSAWENGLIVFDANVLLNLYRYRATTRDEFISTLKALKARVWIPYQAALEFQRNRLIVIADQSSKLNSLKAGIDKALSSLELEIDKNFSGRRNPLIDSAEFIDELTKAKTKFFKEIDKAGGKLPSLTDNDKIKSSLETIFDGKVGVPPGSQDDVDSVYREAEERFKAKLPPGYLDADKAKDGDGDFSHRGMRLQKRFGDYVVWRELLTYAKVNEVKELIFVTDDRKDDWWWSIDSGGKKTIGPRHELIEEARLNGGVDVFLMYQPDRFLEYAKSQLNVNVSEAAVKEVRDLALYNPNDGLRGDSGVELGGRSIEEIDLTPLFDWITKDGGAGFVFSHNEDTIFSDGENGPIRYCVMCIPDWVVSKRASSSQRYFESDVIPFIFKKIKSSSSYKSYRLRFVFYSLDFHTIEAVCFAARRELSAIAHNDIDVTFGWVSSGEKNKGRQFVEFDRVIFRKSE